MRVWLAIGNNETSGLVTTGPQVLTRQFLGGTWEKIDDVLGLGSVHINVEADSPLDMEARFALSSNRDDLKHEKDNSGDIITSLSLNQGAYKDTADQWWKTNNVVTKWFSGNPNSIFNDIINPQNVEMGQDKLKSIKIIDASRKKYQINWISNNNPTQLDAIGIIGTNIWFEYSLQYSALKSYYCNHAIGYISIDGCSVTFFDRSDTVYIYPYYSVKENVFGFYNETDHKCCPIIIDRSKYKILIKHPYNDAYNYRDVTIAQLDYTNTQPYN